MAFPSRIRLGLAVLLWFGCSPDRPVGPAVDPPVVAIEIVGDTLPLLSGGELQLSVTTCDSAGLEVTPALVVWRSLRPQHAVVSSDGLVRGAVPGFSRIMVFSGSAIDSTDIAVEPAAIELAASATELGVGYGTNVTPIFRRLDGRVVHGDLPLQWSSDRPQIATVDTSGRVTGRSPGAVAIHATTGNTRGHVVLNVSGTRVASVAMAGDTLPTIVSDTLRLYASPRDSAGGVLPNRPVLWETSDSAVVRVGQDGLAEFLKAGEATVSAQSDGSMGTVEITVDPGILEFPASEFEILTGASIPGGAVWVPLEGSSTQVFSTVTWSTDPPGVVEVDSAGIITALTPGTATVTASTRSQSADIPVTVSSVTWSRLSTTWLHTCATTDAGAVYCWGLGSRGQLGNGTTEGRQTPSGVLTSDVMIEVSAGGLHSCAATGTGRTSCWGEAYRLGISDTTATLAEPVLSFPAPAPVVLVAGPLSQCALTTAGELHCWGDLGGFGRLTQPTLILLPVPTATAALGYSHGCAVGTDGKTRCWGSSLTALARSENPAQPDTIEQDPGLVQLTAGDNHTCGLAADGSAYCWGEDGAGQLGTDNIPCGPLTCDLDNSPFPAQVDGVLVFQTIDAGSNHTCALTAPGDAYCWGANGNGELGDGTSESRSTPVAVAGGLTFRTIEAAVHHTCAIAIDNRIYCWGRNDHGQIGDGTLESRFVPTRVPGS